MELSSCVDFMLFVFSNSAFKLALWFTLKDLVIKGLHLVVISPPKLTHVYYQNASYNRDIRVLNNGGILIFDWCPLINNWHLGYEWIFSQCDCVRRPIDANTPFSSHDKNTLCNAHKMLACLYPLFYLTELCLKILPMDLMNEARAPRIILSDTCSE